MFAQILQSTNLTQYMVLHWTDNKHPSFIEKSANFTPQKVQNLQKEVSNLHVSEKGVNFTDRSVKI